MYKKSNENWKAGDILINKYPNAAASRIYYSLFQIFHLYAKKNNLDKFVTSYNSKISPQNQIKTKHVQLTKYMLSSFCTEFAVLNKNKTLKIFIYFQSLRIKADYHDDKSVQSTDFSGPMLANAKTFKEYYQSRV